MVCTWTIKQTEERNEVNECESNKPTNIKHKDIKGVRNRTKQQQYRNEKRKRAWTSGMNLGKKYLLSTPCKS